MWRSNGPMNWNWKLDFDNFKLLCAQQLFQAFCGRYFAQYIFCATSLDDPHNNVSSERTKYSLIIVKTS